MMPGEVGGIRAPPEVEVLLPTSLFDPSVTACEVLCHVELRFGWFCARELSVVRCL